MTLTTAPTMTRLFCLFLSTSFAVTGCGLFSGVRSGARKGETRQMQLKDVPLRVRGAFDAPKKRVMVLPFLDSKTTRSPLVAQRARKAVIHSLNMTGQFLVIRNDDFPRDLTEFKTLQSYNLTAIAKIANGLGISAVIEGTVLEIKARRLSDQVGMFRKVRATMNCKVRIRAIACKSGREILNDIRTAKVTTETTRVGSYQSSDRFLEEDPKLINEVTQKAFKGTIPQITLALDKLNWEGRIALVKGDRIYLNAGRLSGLQVGDILKVMEDGEEVFDPETGALIGRVPGRMKGTVELVSYFGRDGAIGIVHSGSGFEENDRVELY